VYCIMVIPGCVRWRLDSRIERIIGLQHCPLMGIEIALRTLMKNVSWIMIFSTLNIFEKEVPC
jgi:hypothetical protein